MTNLLRTIPTKFYQNRPGFVEDITKNILVCFISVHGVVNVFNATVTGLLRCCVQ